MFYILLPAYNEEKSIGLLLQRINDAMQTAGAEYRVVVVNDGSTDRTADIVSQYQEDLPVELINHEVNKGLGQAMQTGLIRAAGLVLDNDVLITMDADNTHDPAIIESMAAKLKNGVNLVIASRYENGGKEVGLSHIRSFLSRGASSLLTMFFPIEGAKDYTCGYRAYQGALVRRAYFIYGYRLVEEHGFTCMAEIIIKMSKINAKVAEVPLVLRYDFKSGPSKMKVVRTILRYFVLIGHNIFHKPPILARGTA